MYSIEKSGMKHKLDQGERSLQQAHDRNAKLMVRRTVPKPPFESGVLPVLAGIPVLLRTLSIGADPWGPQDEKKDLEGKIALSRLSDESISEAVRATPLHRLPRNHPKANRGKRMRTAKRRTLSYAATASFKTTKHPLTATPYWTTDGHTGDSGAAYELAQGGGP